MSGEFIITLSVPMATLHLELIINETSGIPSASAALARGHTTIPLVFLATAFKSFFDACVMWTKK